MVGAYFLAQEIKESSGNYSIAFDKYERSIRNFVEDAQDLAESNQQFLANKDPSIKMMLQLYLMKIMPKKFIQFITRKGRVHMRKVAHGLTLDPVPTIKLDDRPQR